MYRAIFSGSGAEGRAREYADWKNSQEKSTLGQSEFECHTRATISSAHVCSSGE